MSSGFSKHEHAFQRKRVYIGNIVPHVWERFPPAPPVFGMFSSPIFNIEKTFRPQISSFLEVKDELFFLSQPGIEPAPTAHGRQVTVSQRLNQLRYRGTHESLAKDFEV